MNESHRAGASIRILGAAGALCAATCAAQAQEQRMPEVTVKEAPSVAERNRLPGGVALAGPAIVEEMGATTVIPPGWAGAVGAWGELVLTRRSL